MGFTKKKYFDVLKSKEARKKLDYLKKRDKNIKRFRRKLEIKTADEIERDN